MKKILLSALAFILLSFSAQAVDCSDEKEWDEDDKPYEKKHLTYDYLKKKTFDEILNIHPDELMKVSFADES